jgi:hypothetical protein
MSNSSPASAKAKDRERKKQESHPKQLKKARRERLRALVHRGWQVFGVIFGILGAVLTVRYFATRIAVTSAGTVSAQEALGTVFNVTNNGMFTLHDVWHTCMPETVSPSGATVGGGIGFVGGDPNLGDLGPGLTKSLSCEKSIKGAAKASMTILIEYGPGWSPWKFTMPFQFKAVRADDGTWVWKAE